MGIDTSPESDSAGIRLSDPLCRRLSFVFSA